MRIEFNIKIEEEFPREGHTAVIEIDAIINGKEHRSREYIRDDADPVYFDYIWEKIGREIKNAYMRSLE